MLASIAALLPRRDTCSCPIQSARLGVLACALTTYLVLPLVPFVSSCVPRGPVERGESASSYDVEDAAVQADRQEVGPPEVRDVGATEREPDAAKDVPGTSSGYDGGDVGQGDVHEPALPAPPLFCDWSARIPNLPPLPYELLANLPGTFPACVADSDADGRAEIYASVTTEDASGRTIVYEYDELSGSYRSIGNLPIEWGFCSGKARFTGDTADSLFFTKVGRAGALVRLVSRPLRVLEGLEPSVRFPIPDRQRHEPETVGRRYFYGASLVSGAEDGVVSEYNAVLHWRESDPFDVVTPDVRGCGREEAGYVHVADVDGDGRSEKACVGFPVPNGPPADITVLEYSAEARGLREAWSTSTRASFLFHPVALRRPTEDCSAAFLLGASPVPWNSAIDLSLLVPTARGEYVQEPRFRIALAPEEYRAPWHAAPVDTSGDGADEIIFLHQGRMLQWQPRTMASCGFIGVVEQPVGNECVPLHVQAVQVIDDEPEEVLVAVFEVADPAGAGGEDPSLPEYVAKLWILKRELPP